MSDSDGTHTLYFGDTLAILREQLGDDSVDLVYLDPPFNANRFSSGLSTEESSKDSAARIEGLDEGRHWKGLMERVYHELVSSAPQRVVQVLHALLPLAGTSPIAAYLVMLTAWLLELQRVLKPTGTIYLHCDPSASHSLKILMDAIFGLEHFGNEIVWQRTNAKGLAFTRFASNHDVLLRYTKSNHWTWNPQYSRLDPAYVEKFYRFIEPGTNRRYQLADLTNPNPDRPNLTYEFLGVTRVWRWTQKRMQAAYDQGVVIQSQPGMVPRLKRYLDEQEGNPISDIWADIPPIQSSSAERLGVPAQKPLMLLERMILASSNPGDVILDPFCGSGTAIAAAQKLDRRWIGITHQAVSLVVNRMRDMFPGCEFDVVGEPGDMESARHLAQADPTQFCWWACSLVEAIPDAGRKGDRTGKHGSGPGIDAIKLFVDDASNDVKQVFIQVRNCPGKCEDISDLQALLDGDKNALGLFITLEPPTAEMIQEARSAGMYHSQLWNKEYPRLQIVEIADLLQGQRPQLPPSSGAFKRAERVLQRDPKQARLKF